MLLLHAVSTFSSFPQYLDPFKNLLFFAAWPMLAACIALYLLRDLDTMATTNWEVASGPLQKPDNAGTFLSCASATPSIHQRSRNTAVAIPPAVQTPITARCASRRPSSSSVDPR